MDKIILFGGSGHLGSNIRKNLTCIAPTHSEIDITKYSDLVNNSLLHDASTIIHSAGYTNTLDCENDPNTCLEVNVLGTYNLVKYCRRNSIKLIYISTGFVFDGCSDEYLPNSPTCPANIYGLSKASSEFIVRTLKDYLIIRAPFIRTKTFIYENAFDDQFTVRQYVDKAAIDIVNCINNNKQGIQHIVGDYQSIYDLAKQTNHAVGKVKTPEDIKHLLPPSLKLVAGGASDAVTNDI
tara:strand:- start:125 stop:838 length:714 start_codon:yes stop_codon:yes gene_type:complete